MIESIGHTTDGKTWMRVKFNVKDEPFIGTIEMPVDFAEWVVSSLNDAIGKAKDIINDSSRIDKGGT